MAGKLTFGGRDLSQYLVGLSIERSVLPSVEVQTVDVPSADGLILSGRRLKPLEITVRAALAADTASEVAEVRHALGRILNAPGTSRLVTPDEPDVYYNALVSGSTELDRAYGRPMATITFLVPEACAWSPTQKSAQLSLNRTTVIDVGGNAQTWPTLKLVTKADATPALVTRYPTEADDRSVTYGLGKVMGNMGITADMLAQTTVYGTKEAFPDLGYDYFSIGPGETSINVTNAYGTITWYERWV